MMLLDQLNRLTVRIASSPADEDPLAGTSPDSLRSASDAELPPARVVGCLVLLALVLRGVMAALLPSACDDAYYYLSVASQMGAGNLEVALQYLNLNIFPPLLLGLRHLGLDWLIATRIWGALISSLTVVPIYCLVRSLFDHRIAAVAGFLYVVHPSLIEMSVEPAREPTFWFLFACGVWTAQRAVDRQRWSDFALAGLVMCLAAHTRTEGWLLFPAMLLQATARILAERPAWRRLAAGVVLCFACTPTLIVATNLTLLRNHSQWEWGRLSHLEMAHAWASSVVGIAPADSPKSLQLIGSPRPHRSKETAVADSRPVVGDTVPAAEAATPIETGTSQPAPDLSEVWTPRVVLEFLATCSKLLSGAVEPQFLLLMGIGLLAGWRSLFRLRCSVMPLLSLGIIGAVVVYAGFTLLAFSRVRINSRYFFTAFLMLLPYASMGLLVTVRWLQQQNWFLPAAPHRSRLVAPVVAALFLTIGAIDAWTTRHKGREREVQLANWLRENCGPVERVLVSRGAERPGFHITRNAPSTTWNAQPLPEVAAKEQPDLVILKVDTLSDEHRKSLVDQTVHSTSPPLEQVSIPDFRETYVVLRRPAAPLTTTATGNSGTSRR